MFGNTVCQQAFRSQGGMRLFLVNFKHRVYIILSYSVYLVESYKSNLEVPVVYPCIWKQIYGKVGKNSPKDRKKTGLLTTGFFYNWSFSQLVFWKLVFWKLVFWKLVFFKTGLFGSRSFRTGLLDNWSVLTGLLDNWSFFNWSFDNWSFENWSYDNWSFDYWTLIPVLLDN